MAEKSWWLDCQTREELAAAAIKEQLRMSLSKEAAQVNGMTVAWSKKIGGKK